MVTGRFTPMLADSGSVFVWCIVLTILVIGGIILVVWIRRKLSPDENFHGEGFSIGDLRRLHKEGKLSDEEYERAKQLVVAGLQQHHAAPVDPKAQTHDFKTDFPGDSP